MANIVTELAPTRSTTAQHQTSCCCYARWRAPSSLQLFFILSLAIIIFLASIDNFIGVASFHCITPPPKREPFLLQSTRRTTIVDPTENKSERAARRILTMADSKPSALEQTIASIGKSLLDDVIDAADPSPEQAVDIIQTLLNESTKKNKACTVTIAILESTKIGKILTKYVKACNRHKRTASDTEKKQWDDALGVAQTLLEMYKKSADEEAKQIAIQKKKNTAKTTSDESRNEGLPASTSAYKTRLVTQKKDMYKDPPALPPAHITIEETYVGIPKRNKTTGELTFKPGKDSGLSKALSDFHPNRTPEEVLRAGSFGGTYFRPIVSAVTNVKYNAADVLKDTVQPEWIDGLNKTTLLTSSTYRPGVNKFGVKCGGSLGMWESSGWISDSDPYGWFQWYCRFYQGRRCSDDPRQISRWSKSAGPKGRFRSQLCNKIIAANTHAGNAKISPVIRQTLLHWGLEITEEILTRHKNR